MATSLLVALKSIPWKKVLARVPALMKAVEVLYSRAGARKSYRATVRQAQALNVRVGALEGCHEDNAKLMKRLVDQVQALTTASQVLTARLRLMLVLVIFSTAVAVAALAVATGRG